MADDLQITVVNDPQTVAVPQPDIQVLTETSAQPVVVESTAVEVVTLDDEVHVVDEVRDIQIVTVGEAGPRGAQGATGSSAAGAQANFAYGDATPAVITTAAADKVVYSVEVVIVVAFDGVGAAITVGDAAVPDRLMSAVENAPAVVGSHTTAPAYSYGTDTPVLLTITPGAGASQGRGIVIIRVQS